MVEPPRKRWCWSGSRTRFCATDSTSQQTDHARDGHYEIRHDCENQRLNDESLAQAISRPNATTLTSLPSELQQDIFLFALRGFLADYIDGERKYRDTVLALATTSRTTRGNIIAVIKIIRMEIAHLPSFGLDDDALLRCNHMAAMRILVSTLEYNLTTGSRIPIRIGRYKKVLPESSDWLWKEMKITEARQRTVFVP